MKLVDSENQEFPKELRPQKNNPEKFGPKENPRMELVDKKKLPLKELVDPKSPLILEISPQNL